MLKRLANWLYYRYGDVDVAEMTRLQLMGHIDRKKFGDMSNAEKMETKNQCVDLMSNPALKYVIDEYIGDVKDHILYESNTEQQVLLGRFSLNGASAVFERIEEYSRWKPEKQDTFNKFETI